MGMKIDDVLKEMSSEINGYIGSVVVGLDGIYVGSFIKGHMDPDMVSAQLALLVKLVDTSVTKMGAGSMTDDLLTTQNTYLMMKFLPDKQHFLGVVADRKNANIGNLRLIVKMYTDRIARVMPQ